MLLGTTDIKRIMLTGVLAAGLCSPALAESEQTVDEPVATPEYVITMGDVRDIGLCVEQIKHQAVFIYLEATRKEPTVSTPAKIIEPAKIPVAGVNFKEKYPPARREWLVFYIASMEPMIRLLGEDVKDVQNGAYLVKFPHANKQQVDKLWHQWTSTVGELNTSLDHIQASLETESGNNRAVADQAVAIFNAASNLESIRLKVHHLLQAGLKHNKPVQTGTDKAKSVGAHES